MKHFVVSLFALVLGLAIGQAQNRSVDLMKNEPLDKILKQAKIEKKHVFLDFGSPQCSPCLYMKSNIFTIDSVADFVNERFVSCDYMEGNEKNRLSEIYGVHAEPVFLILDSDGNLMHRTQGRMSADEMLRRFRTGLDMENNLTAQGKKYDAGLRDPQFIESYLDNLHVAGLDERKAKVLKNIFDDNFDVTKLEQSNYWTLFVTYDESPVSRQSRYVVENRAHFCELYGASAVNGKLNRTFGGHARIFIFGKTAPAENTDFADILRYAQLCDWEGSKDWLIYLVPAQYKFKDWMKMGEAIEWARDFNIFVGTTKQTFMKMMSEQLCWYCNNPQALQYSIKWIDELLPSVNEDVKRSLSETREATLRKIEQLVGDR